MSKELVIASNRHETKVAILEEDQLTEIYFQRANEYSLAGSIHKGRVTRVLPGMQSAFVDLGLERDTFLYVSDFFEEENEDIDTVAEDKPARGGDRRERGGQRPVDRVPVIVQEVESVGSPEPAAAAAAEPAVIDEVAVPLALESSPAGEEGRGEPRGEGRGNEQRPDGDRGGFRDRRGRRSRRRRSRGQGFPENKYAQPGSESAPVERSANTATASGIDEVEGGEEEAADVIILPGESLAKYRRVPSASTSAREEVRQHEQEPVETTPDSLLVPEENDTDLGADLQDEVLRDEELEAEAQEIELVDKILSHHSSSSVIEEEEKLEEVREEPFVSPFVIDQIESEEAATEPPSTHPEFSAREQTIEVVTLEQQEPAPPEPSVSVREGIDQADIQPASAETSADAVFPGEVPSDEEEGHDDESAEPLDFEGADLEDAEPFPPLSDTPAEPGPEPSGGAVQSAVVREGGDRYMHRVSRRMRRRRGGNRFSQGGPSSEGNGPTVSAAAGAAPAPVERSTERPERSNERPERSSDRPERSSDRPERSSDRPERSSEKPERVMPSIAELLKPGQEIIVQIAKEPLGQKGARITSHIALPGRYVVFMPSVTHLGVSRKIESDEERQRLKRILQTHREGTTGGFIVRTAGAGIPEEDIAADMDFLYKLWLDIRKKAEKRPAPMLLHYDLDIVQRTLRDQMTEDFKAIWVDSEEMYENVLSFTQRFQPALVSRVKMYTRSAPIFDAFGITQELEKALRPKVWLKSGGYIVINQTEALVAIDINTGKYVGKSNRLEDTIVKTNIEAVKEIVRQIRLRDLGGIIVVDFIDMDERKNRQKVMQALEEAMHMDKAPYKILQFNDFGLVAITRKRVKQSLERTLCAPCPYCEGAGYVKSVQTIISEILVEAQKIAKALEGKDVMLRVHPDVAKVLKANDNRYLEELEEILARPVLVKGDPALHHEKFDLG